MRFISVASVAVAIATVFAAKTARANPKTLPYSYGTATSPPGAMEVEAIVDLVPIRVAKEQTDGTLLELTALRYQLTTEFEYGLTDRLELGFYMAFMQGAAADGAPLVFQSIKQRVRFRLSEPEAWPVDVGLYFELAEAYNEIEFEEKILLQRRFGPLTAVANLWIEQEYYFTTDESRFVYNPTLGLTWTVVPGLTLGAEYWARGRFDNDDRSRHYVGPTVQVARGEYWFALGAYMRVDNLGKDEIVNDAFGRLWFRVIAGIGL